MILPFSWSSECDACHSECIRGISHLLSEEILQGRAFQNDILVISNVSERSHNRLAWREILRSTTSVQNDSHVIPSKGVSPTRNPLLHIHFNRDSSSLRSSEWHRLSSRTYVRDLTIDSFGWRFFKAKPFRMTCVLV